MGRSPRPPRPPRAVDEGFTALYDVEYPRIARTAYLVLHDAARAEEVAQEAFVRLYLRWGTVGGYDRPGAWVRRVAIRLAVREAQREERRPRLERRTSPPPTTPERDVDVLRAVGELPARQRAVVVLFYFEDLPVAEVAHALAMSESAVKTSLHRARATLATRLDEEVSDVRR
ncbi:RNA polymerase sigma factor [Oryzobacter terrae]|uniref:RNA polymerase sigma factor n=1 Tax=Oryzobacter terrae TaxID=1620385 RepID=UPI00366F7BA1